MSASSNLMSKQITFVGAGAMAEAIIRGLIETKRTVPERLRALNHRNQARLQQLQETYNVRVTEHPHERAQAIAGADFIVLAMKPKDASQALAEIAPFVHEQQLVISVIAGLSIRTIADSLPANVPIVRTMPNTSSTIGCGVTGISFSAQVSAQQREEVLDMFRAIGVTAAVDESRLDLVTGLSGSGPAYVYYMMEAMIQAGIEGGLPEDIAKSFVVQTVYGAAKMVQETGQEPHRLREKVTSPGGTTEAALQQLARDGFPEIVQNAVQRAAERADELGQMMEAKSHDR